MGRSAFNYQKVLRSRKIQVCAVLVVATFVYLLGIEWPLLIAVTAALAIFLPMPRVFSSWLSRSVVSLLILYALLQLAALVQFVLYPSGGFTLIAPLLLVLTAALIGLYGRTPEKGAVSIVSAKDMFALIPCILFILSFSRVLLGSNRLEKVVVMAGTQISDSVAHYGGINGYLLGQQLDYKVDRYYPAGFHIATAFIEHSFLGDGSSLSWGGRVVIYAAQYLVLGMLLGFVLVYFGYALILGMGTVERDRFTHLTVATAVGVSAVIMYLLLFVNEGFINYYYVCMTVLVATAYLLDREIAYGVNLRPGQNVHSYTWPVAAFLLLGFGAGFSWTLLVPAVLLSAALIIFPNNIVEILRHLKDYLLANIVIALLVMCNLVSLYFQYKYMKNSGQILLYGGGITSFNVPLLLLGLAAITFIICRGAPSLGRRLVAAVIPYIAVVAALMIWQMFVLGGVTYYVIKSAMILEMFGLAAVTATVIYALQGSKLNRVYRSLWAVAIVLFLVLSTISLMPHPLQEVRGLFRDASGMGKPPFLDSDAKAIAYLGGSNKIIDFNVTILHYDAAGKRFYAQIETALWANAMVKAYADATQSITQGKSGNCFGKQYLLLAYGTGSTEDQGRLIASVKDCIVVAQSKHLPYYIVTDGGSAAMLTQTFGYQPVLITQ